MKHIQILGIVAAVTLLGCVSTETTRAAGVMLTRADVEQMVHDEIARMQSNTDFDPESDTFQPYYVPILANSDGTMLTVSRINAAIGDFASGINVSDTDTGETYCVTVSSGSIVASFGRC